MLLAHTFPNVLSGYVSQQLFLIINNLLLILQNSDGEFVP